MYAKVIFKLLQQVVGAGGALNYQDTSERDLVIGAALHFVGAQTLTSSAGLGRRSHFLRGKC
jgi:hypothetical protein